MPSDQMILPESYCNLCGSDTRLDTYYYHNHLNESVSIIILCSDCSIYINVCSNCNHSRIRSPLRNNILYDQSFICDVCIDSDDFINCYNCNRWIDRNDSIEVNGEEYCPRCETSLIRCYNCEDIISDDDYRYHREEPYCISCFDESFFYCDNCGDACSIDEMNLSQYDRLCNCCYYEESENNSNDRLLQYDARVNDNPIFNPDSREKDLFGIELETEVSDEYDTSEIYPTCLDMLNESISDFAIAKEDGSLSCNGIEFVSRPSVYSIQKQNWKRMLDSIPRGLESDNHRNCGLHVNFDRRYNPLSDLHVGKMLKFVNRSKNRLFVEYISERRSSNGYASYLGDKKITDCRIAGPKYQALNIRHRDRLEFRMFKGTLKLKSILKAMEFVLALKYWSKFQSIRELDYKSFLTYVRQNKKEYSNLYTHIQKNRNYKERN